MVNVKTPRASFLLCVWRECRSVSPSAGDMSVEPKAEVLELLCLFSASFTVAGSLRGTRSSAIWGSRPSQLAVGIPSQSQCAGMTSRPPCAPNILWGLGGSEFDPYA